MELRGSNSVMLANKALTRQCCRARFARRKLRRYRHTMNRALSLIFLIFCFSAFGENIRWNDQPAYKIDIDCDGSTEDVRMGFIENDFVIEIKASGTGKKSSLQFGLAQPSRQDAICGTSPGFSTYKSDADAQKMLFDEIFEGYKSGEQCFDLNISGGECDSITVYFNHKTQELNWWRP